MKMSSLALRGYKSFSRECGPVSFGDVTVLLGANGAGKSNLLSFFRLLNFLEAGCLQSYVGRQGAASLLFMGPKRTPALNAALRLEGGAGESCDYELELAFGLPDRLFIGGERIVFRAGAGGGRRELRLAAAGGPESGLRPAAGDAAARAVAGFLSGIRVYQFHDTSETAPVRLASDWRVNGARLAGDAGNLAAFLCRMRQDGGSRRHYERIVRHIRQTMPRFGDFVFDEGRADGAVMLSWRDDRDPGYLYGPHQLSDGSLRFMALAALLLQPPASLPSVIVIDEPELGLHPSAVAGLAGMVKIASVHAQVVLATQSPLLVDEFPCGRIVIVEHDAEKGTTCRRLDEQSLQGWLAANGLRPGYE